MTAPATSSTAQLVLSPSTQTIVAPDAGSLTLTLPRAPAVRTVVDLAVSDRQAVLVSPFWFDPGQTASTMPVLTFRGSDSVTVMASYGGSTASANLRVLYPPPVITRVFPPTLTVGVYQPYLQVFDASSPDGPRTIFPASVVRWNGVPLDTQLVVGDSGLPTFLWARIRPMDVQRPGTATITVVNPSPGGGTSASLPVEIVGGAPAPVPTLSPLAAAALVLLLGASGFLGARRG